MPLLSVFLDNLLPIFLCAATGVALGRAFQPDLRTVTRLSFYIFSPCLVFASLTQTPVAGEEFAQLAVFTLGHIGLMVALTAALGLAVRLERRTLLTLIIAAVFVNGGNYGLAANRFAFGEAALARALVFYVFSTIGVYTVGIFLASLGKRPVAGALREVVTVPTFYALLAAGLVRVTGSGVPLFVDRAVTLLGEAAVPVMLVLLGLQIARMTRADWARVKAGAVALAVGLQLIVAPLVALALAAGLGLTGVTRQAAVLEASMPTAVITTVLALQYELDMDLVTGAVIASTLLSPLTLSPLIVYLQAGG